MGTLERCAAEITGCPAEKCIVIQEIVADAWKGQESATGFSDHESTMQVYKRKILNFEFVCVLPVPKSLVKALVGACLATGDRMFATGSDSVSKIVLRSCGCFCLISGHTIMV